MQRRTCPGSLTLHITCQKGNEFPTQGNSENKGWDRESQKMGQGKSKDGTRKVKRWDKESQEIEYQAYLYWCISYLMKFDKEMLKKLD